VGLIIIKERIGRDGANMTEYNDECMITFYVAT